MARTAFSKRPSHSKRPASPPKQPRLPPTPWPDEERREVETLWRKTQCPKKAQKEELADILAEASCKKGRSKDRRKEHEYYLNRISNWFKNKRQKSKGAKHAPVPEGEGSDRSQHSLIDHPNPTSRMDFTTPGYGYRTASATLRSARPVAPVHHYVAYQEAGGCLECHEATGCDICMTCLECLEVRECQQCPRFFDESCCDDKTCDIASDGGDCEAAQFPVEFTGLLLLASCIESAGLGWSK